MNHTHSFTQATGGEARTFLGPQEAYLVFPFRCEGCPKIAYRTQRERDEIVKTRVRSPFGRGS